MLSSRGASLLPPLVVGKQPFFVPAALHNIRMNIPVGIRTFRDISIDRRSIDRCDRRHDNHNNAKNEEGEEKRKRKRGKRGKERELRETGKKRKKKPENW